jgi:hypothetical protein
MTIVVINVIILMAIGEYFIGGYWWLFHYKPLRIILLLAILLMVINGYCIISYY